MLGFPAAIVVAVTVVTISQRLNYFQTYFCSVTLPNIRCDASPNLCHAASPNLCCAPLPDLCRAPSPYRH